MIWRCQRPSHGGDNATRRVKVSENVIESRENSMAVSEARRSALQLSTNQGLWGKDDA